MPRVGGDLVSRRIRWLLMAGHVPPGGLVGGIVRYTTELARALSHRDDVDLCLLGSWPAAAPLTQLVDGADRVVRLPPLPATAIPAFERFALGHLLQTRFDVVQGTKDIVP